MYCKRGTQQASQLVNVTGMQSSMPWILEQLPQPQLMSAMQEFPDYGPALRLHQEPTVP